MILDDFIRPFEEALVSGTPGEWSQSLTSEPSILKWFEETAFCGRCFVRDCCGWCDDCAIVEVRDGSDHDRVSRYYSIPICTKLRTKPGFQNSKNVRKRSSRRPLRLAGKWVAFPWLQYKSSLGQHVEFKRYRWHHHDLSSTLNVVNKAADIDHTAQKKKKKEL